jgi:hypothetical protein
MTVHLITVGNSLRENRAEHPRFRDVMAEGDFADADRLGITVDNDVDRAARATVDGLLRRLGGEGGPDAVAVALVEEACRDLGAVSDNGANTWPACCSAESESLNSVTGRHTVSAGDLVVLLVSDTPVGLLSGLWNAVHLAGPIDTFQRLDYAGGDTKLEGLGARGRVRIQVVSDLDLARPGRFNEAMGRLGEIGCAVLRDLNHDEDILVHLSGGYKATIPFMIGIAEGMRSVSLGGLPPASVRAVVVHRDSVEGHRRRPVDVPLRRLKEGDLRTELREFDASDRARCTTSGAVGRGNDALLGYAYDQTEQGATVAELTPFGHGLRALVGLEAGTTG